MARIERRECDRRSNNESRVAIGGWGDEGKVAFGGHDANALAGIETEARVAGLGVMDTVRNIHLDFHPAADGVSCFHRDNRETRGP